MTTNNKKFRYYITDLYEGNNGSIVGTDNHAIAMEASEYEDKYVVDTHTGRWLTYAGIDQNVEECFSGYTKKAWPAKDYFTQEELQKRFEDSPLFKGVKNDPNQ